jgi:hypothetical protein
MNKKIGALVFGMVLLLAGCGSYYTLINETPPAGDLKAYKTLSVGWLDLGDDKAKTYGFEGADAAKWPELINEINLKSFPQFLKDFLPGKTVHTVSSKTQEPQKDGLVITFTEVNYVQQTSTGAQVMFGSFAGSDTLDLVIHFVDANTGRELATSKVSIGTKAGTGYSQWSFEGRVTNGAYNLARYIAEKVR